MPPQIAFLAASILLLSPATGVAHAFLQSSNPPVGATVASSPGAVSITYTEGVEPAFSSLTVQDAQGTDMAGGTLRAAPGDQATLVLPLRELPPGTYHVRWHVVSVDTHKTEGDFRFTVAP